MPTSVEINPSFTMLSSICSGSVICSLTQRESGATVWMRQDDPPACLCFLYDERCQRGHDVPSPYKQQPV
jgi:hypothetical protein